MLEEEKAFRADWKADWDERGEDSTINENQAVKVLGFGLNPWHFNSVCRTLKDDLANPTPTWTAVQLDLGLLERAADGLTRRLRTSDPIAIAAVMRSGRMAGDATLLDRLKTELSKVSEAIASASAVLPSKSVRSAHVVDDALGALADQMEEKGLEVALDRGPFVDLATILFASVGERKSAYDSARRFLRQRK